MTVPLPPELSPDSASEGMLMVCSGCGIATWLAEHCRGYELQTPLVHFARESSAREMSWRLICGESMRCNDFRTTDPDEANCQRCRAILDREARAAA